MKVLQINSTCGFGSTGRIAVDILNTITKNGDEGIICYGRGSAPEGVPSYRIGNENLVKIHGVLSRITDRQGFYSTKATKELVEKIKEYDPDIIHLHNVHGYYLDIRVLFEYLKTCNKPIVWTLHDCWTFTGHCAYFDYAGCDKWITQCNNCPQKRAYPQSLIMDNSEKNYIDKKHFFASLKDVTLVTPSYWLADVVKKSFLGAYPVNTIYNGIDLEIFKPTDSDFRKKHNIEDKRVYLGVASVWEERKGLRDLLEISKMLNENEKMVIVGLNDTQYEELPKSIIGIKRTESAKELAEIYTAADVFINPSYEETMGLTTVEALACGTPVVVYNATAVPEVVDDNCGIVVEAGDVAGLLKAIEKISFSECDCIRRANDFEKNQQYAKYFELYRNIIQK